MYLSTQDLAYEAKPQTHTRVLNIYDFDGVIASPFEEALFTLPETPFDKSFIKTCERKFDLDLSLESTRSARYISMQAVCLAMGWPIQPGPMFPFVEGPFYILTARCDRFAVARMYQFIEFQMPEAPIKTMHVDHLSKGIMLNMLLTKHPDVQINFWDDNINHVESARALQSERLLIFHVDNDMTSFYKDAQFYYTNQILESVL